MSTHASASALIESLRSLDATSTQYASEFLKLLLPAARQQGVSDVHLQPTPEGLELCWRLDGVLQPLARFPSGEVTDIVTRLKVLASLLTYRTDTPQEGRIPGGDGVEMRVSTFPTLHGERATVRLFAESASLLRVADLGYPAELTQWLGAELTQTAGALLVSGPAGSGKTTTLYACLREMVHHSNGSRSIITMEDPIEAAVNGVAQSQVHEAVGLTLGTGIRSLVRQDPEVIMIGEIRDAEAARAALGASLTGHLVVTSFHAGSNLNALRRLRDMGLESYMLRNGIIGMINQRLARRLCSKCARPATQAEFLGLRVASAQAADGCDACLGTGFAGRFVLAQWRSLRIAPFPANLFDGDNDKEAVKDDREDSNDTADGQSPSLWRQGVTAVETGLTSPLEIRRIFGWDVAM